MLGMTVMLHCLGAFHCSMQYCMVIIVSPAPENQNHDKADRHCLGNQEYV